MRSSSCPNPSPNLNPNPNPNSSPTPTLKLTLAVTLTLTPTPTRYEAVELPRKLLLMGVLCFVASGSAAQIYFGVLVALITLLMLTRFVPFADRSVDLVCWLTHLCTLLTLLCALALHAGFHDEDAWPGE